MDSKKVFSNFIPLSARNSKLRKLLHSLHPDDSLKMNKSGWRKKKKEKNKQLRNIVALTGLIRCGAYFVCRGRCSLPRLSLATFPIYAKARERENFPTSFATTPGGSRASRLWEEKKSSTLGSEKNVHLWAWFNIFIQIYSMDFFWKFLWSLEKIDGWACVIQPEKIYVIRSTADRSYFKLV